MSNQPIRKLTGVTDAAGELDGARVGSIVEIDLDGRPIVRFAGAIRPVRARVAALSDCSDASSAVGASVILVFENGDPDLPIIVGFVRDTLSAVRSAGARAPLEAPAEGCRSVELNGRTLVLEGKDELVLRCGLGSLTIRADGQVIIKGTRLTSKASETNKIRGASVLIN